MWRRRGFHLQQRAWRWTKESGVLDAQVRVVDLLVWEFNFENRGGRGGVLGGGLGRVGSRDGVEGKWSPYGLLWSEGAKTGWRDT